MLAVLLGADRDLESSVLHLCRVLMRIRHIILPLMLVPSVSVAQSRRCAENPPDTTERVRSLERETADLYQRATSHHSGVNPAQMRGAIERANELCRAGSDRALYWLALANHTLINEEDAARLLDEYLAAHPIERLNAAERSVVERLRQELSETLARIEVVVTVPGVTVRVGGAPVDRGVTYAHPGSVVIEASSPEHEPATVTLQVTAVTVRLALVEGDDVAIPNGAHRLTLRRRAPPASIGSGPTQPSVISPPAPPQIPPFLPLPAESPPPHSFRPWAIAATVGAGASLLAGTAFAIWSTTRNSTYQSLSCATIVNDQCQPIYDEINTADALTLASFVTAGVFAASTVALWALDRRETSQAHRQASVRLNCSPTIGGLRCTW